MTKNGPTVTTQKNIITIIEENKEGNFDLKNVHSASCETSTLKTEGIVLIGFGVALLFLAGPEIASLSGLSELIAVFAH